LTDPGRAVRFHRERRRQPKGAAMERHDTSNTSNEHEPIEYEAPCILELVDVEAQLFIPISN
jgi:hypothetical protein